MGTMGDEQRAKRRGGMLFLHGVWVEQPLYDYIKSKGPKRGSEWMRGALSLVRAAEIKRDEARAAMANDADEAGNDAGGEE